MFLGCMLAQCMPHLQGTISSLLEPGLLRSGWCTCLGSGGLTCLVRPHTHIHPLPAPSTICHAIRSVISYPGISVSWLIASPCQALRLTPMVWQRWVLASGSALSWRRSTLEVRSSSPYRGLVYHHLCCCPLDCPLVSFSVLCRPSLVCLMLP